jgi:hypothetical protein
MWILAEQWIEGVPNFMLYFAIGVGIALLAKS